MKYFLPKLKQNGINLERILSRSYWKREEGRVQQVKGTKEMEMLSWREKAV